MYAPGESTNSSVLSSHPVRNWMTIIWHRTTGYEDPELQRLRSDSISRSTYKRDVATFSTSFLLVFLAFNATQNLQSSINKVIRRDSAWCKLDSNLHWKANNALLIMLDCAMISSCRGRFRKSPVEHSISAYQLAQPPGQISLSLLTWWIWRNNYVCTRCQDRRKDSGLSAWESSTHLSPSVPSEHRLLFKHLEPSSR